MITLIKGIIQFTVILTQFLLNRRMLKAGEAEALLKIATKANERIQKAIAARRAVDPDSMPKNDSYRRD